PGIVSHNYAWFHDQPVLSTCRKPRGSSELEIYSQRVIFKADVTHLSFRDGRFYNISAVVSRL
ncbi:MAG: hypothetical protein PVJ22_09655, partial [Desulfobacterales bacterium]